MTPSNLHSRPSQFIHYSEIQPLEDVCGKIREICSTPHISIAYLHLSGMAKPHLHKVMEEFYHITKGEGYLTLGKEKHPIGEGDTITIPKNVIHFLETDPEKTIEVLVITYPRYNREDLIVV